jgi:pimeloyl-ACP methyl ester carboxylesterase
VKLLQATSFVEEMVAINALNPKHFDAFWGSAMQFPLSGIQSKIGVLVGRGEATQLVVANEKRNRLHVHVMWGDADDVVPFQPSYNRWKQQFLADGLRTAKTEVRGDVRVEIVDQGPSGSLVKFTVIDRLKHAFMIEQPTVVLPLIAEFIQNIDSCGASAPRIDESSASAI